MTYYRIQTADRDVTAVLGTDNISGHWNGSDNADYHRRGVSVCASREDLAAYLAQSGIPYGVGEWVIVSLDGDLSDDTPYDAEYGELLIHPTEIVSVSPMDSDDEFHELIAAAYDDEI